jgi:very-short-patch-repair endonuclease
MCHHGIPVTTPARTAFDLAAILPPHQVERAVHEIDVQRLWHGPSLTDLLTRYPTARGTRTIRAILDDPSTGISRNDFEAEFRAFLREIGLWPFEANVWIPELGTEADFAWRDKRLMVEIDGAATHHTRTAFEEDRARDRRATAAGWRVMRITYRQFIEDREALARDLTGAYAASA